MTKRPTQMPAAAPKAPRKQPAKKAATKMDRSQIHSWANTATAVGAFIVAVYAAWMSQQALNLKREKLGFDVLPDSGCRVQYIGSDKMGELGLCWQVTITNQSEDKLSIVSHKAFSVGRKAGLNYMSGFREVEDQAGNEIPFPLTLDGGEAKAVYVRVGFLISDPKEAGLIQAFLRGRPTPAAMAELQQYLVEHNIDLADNSLSVRHIDEKNSVWSIVGPTKYDEAGIRFITGRKSVMVATMSYPPRLDGSDSQ
jgi:hypothetical protein